MGNVGGTWQRGDTTEGGHGRGGHGRGGHGRVGGYDSLQAPVILWELFFLSSCVPSQVPITNPVFS